MKAITEPTAPTAATARAQAMLRPRLGLRYRVIEQLGDLDTPSGSAVWSTFLAYDTSLRRNVVLRVASREVGDTRDLHDRVHRAMRAAQLNAHLIARIYDAVIDGDSSMMAPPATTAIIISEYFAGETLQAALERGDHVNQSALLAALAHRVADAADADVSFGILTPANVVLTPDGPAIASLPAGTVGTIGPTSLDTLAESMRTNLFARAVRRVRRASARLAHSA